MENRVNFHCDASFSFGIPNFSSSDPSIFFNIYEHQFQELGITSSHLKFTHVISGLPEEVVEIVKDIIANTPSENSYETLKKTLIERLRIDASEKIKQSLFNVKMENEKPTCFLNRLETLSSGCVGDNTEMIRSTFLKNLPCYLRKELSHLSHMPLNRLALMADVLYDNPPENNPQKLSISCQTEGNALQNSISNLQETIEVLTNKIEDLVANCQSCSRNPNGCESKNDKTKNYDNRRENKNDNETDAGNGKKTPPQPQIKSRRLEVLSPVLYEYVEPCSWKKINDNEN